MQQAQGAPTACGARCARLLSSCCRFLWQITAAITEKVSGFVLEHRHVRPSPIHRDTVLIRDTDGRETIRVGKLLCEIGLQQLYLEFIAANPELKGVIGERSFRYLMPPQMRRMHKRYMSMCGCKICTEFHGLHRSLQVFRGVRKAKANAGGQPFTPSYEHAAPGDAVRQATCPAVQPQEGFPHANCWMSRCTLCHDCELYKVSTDEDRTDDNAPTITYNLYEYHLEDTQFKNPDGTKKQAKRLRLSQNKAKIGDFMRKVCARHAPTFCTALLRPSADMAWQVYRPKLVEYIYHSTLARLLNKCRVERKHLSPGDLNDLRDFSEKLAAAFDGEIQSEHWQNTSVTIEVSVIEAYCKDAVDAFLDRGETGPGDGTSWQHRDQVRYHISDFPKQDAPVVHRNMDATIAKLTERGAAVLRAKPGSTPRVKQKVDGCAKQYRSSKSCAHV